MIKLSKIKPIYLLSLLGIALAAKLCALLIDTLLPAAVLQPVVVTTQPLDYRAQFAAAFGLQAVAAKPKVREVKKETAREVDSMEGYRLSSTILGAPNYVIIVKNDESAILATGESHRGFTLREVEIDRAKFSKRGKVFWLRMREQEVMKTIAQRPAPRKKKKKSVVVPDARIIQEDSSFFIPREVIRANSAPSQMAKHIAVRPLYKNKKLEGFNVTRIDQRSIFAKLGLKKGDIIVALNGKPIESETQPMKIFANIDTVDTLAISVRRGKETKELRYEVY